MADRKFSQRSLNNLAGVHPDLVRCAELALQASACDFTVIEGLRTAARQKELIARGASRTMRSYHLRHGDGYGHAIDLYPYYNGSVQGASTPKSPEERKQNEACWREIARAMKQAASSLGIRITWGGDWKSFCDMPHYQYEGKANG